MAGSIAWYKYVDDRGRVWGKQLDEDLGGLTGAGFTPVTAADTALDTMPQGMTMRGVNAVQTSGAGAGYVYRFWACGTKESAIYMGTTKTFTVNGLTYAVTSTRGEKRRDPSSLNTGQVGKGAVVGGGGGTGS